MQFFGLSWSDRESGGHCNTLRIVLHLRWFLDDLAHPCQDTFDYAECMALPTFYPVPLSSLSVGVIVVDHGSRRGESNELLFAVVQQFAEATGLSIVEPAHMELAEPSIDTAFSRCVARGAKLVVVFPYFLSPGRHWQDDIPQLTVAAARKHPGVRYLVTAPFGLHPLMAEVMRQRIEHCLAHTHGQADACELCAGTDHCQLRAAGA
jgi:sirohydrochlorin ferrochelatase